MRDDFLSADWADHHSEMSNGIHRLVKSIAVALAALFAYQFDAPWKPAGWDRDA
jgi:hypothetical protein